MRFIALIFLFAFSQVSALNAEIYDDELLFKKGAWEVLLTHNTQNGTLWCEAVTSNQRGQFLSLAGFEDGQMALFVFDETWRLARRPVDFIVDINYSRWLISGEASDSSVSVFLENSEKAAKFLREMQQGDAVAVYNDAERKLATFSLSGSYAAILALFECWGSLGKTSDPFGTSGSSKSRGSDPF